jgi:hypothetical protein
MGAKEVVPHQMSQQAAAGRGGGHGGGRGKSRYHPQGGVDTKKAFKSAISEIAEDTFNTGQNKFTAQFTQSRKNVSNYLQRTSATRGTLLPRRYAPARNKSLSYRQPWMSPRQMQKTKK